MAWAQAYPARPVRIIVGFAAGGPNDIAARLIGQSLSERLGRPFVIENRPGAGSNTAAEAIVRAPPDGYTLFQASATNAFNATLYDNLNFDFVRDIAPVANLYRTTAVMEVNPSVPAKTVPRRRGDHGAWTDPPATLRTIADASCARRSDNSRRPVVRHVSAQRACHGVMGLPAVDAADDGGTPQTVLRAIERIGC
jgi:Tripartite tricarboxylate transporter family receptor